MIVVKNVKTIAGDIIDHTIESERDETIDAESRLLLLPALIDPYINGGISAEDWKATAQAALAGGVTFAFDAPHACANKEAFEAKIRQIDSKLAEANIPFRYRLYLRSEEESFEEIGQLKEHIIAMETSMGSLSDEALNRLFQTTAQHDMIIAIHAEDQEAIRQQQEKFTDVKIPAIHSEVHHRNAALQGTEKAIEYAQKYNAQVLLLHVSTKEEIELIRQAKQQELMIHCAVTPHHLFLTDKDYEHWGTKVQVDPPLRTQEDQEALWAAINDGIVDMIASDHNPHPLEEKTKPYGEAPSGIPGIETMLPLLLNAYHEKKLNLETIAEITHRNIELTFNLPPNHDVVLIDLEKEQEVKDENLTTPCKWSPYTGRTLKGWPVYTIVKGQICKLY